jgi:Domain of unknown function (DUF4283)
MGADLLLLPRARRQPYYCQKGTETHKKAYIINVGTVQVLPVGDVRREQLTDFSPCLHLRKGHTTRMMHKALPKWKETNLEDSAQETTGPFLSYLDTPGTSSQKLTLSVGQIIVLACDLPYTETIIQEPFYPAQGSFTFSLGHPSPDEIKAIGLQCEATHHTKCPTYKSPKPIPSRICSFMKTDPNLLSHNKGPNMNLSNDELIAKFSSLNAGGTTGEADRLMMPPNALNTRNWSLCAVARVITDRMMMDTQFVDTMMRVWNLSPQSSIEAVAKATYLVQFSDTIEMYNVLDKGIWTYRTELVALRRATKPADLTQEFVHSAELVVQLHNIPPETFSPQGIYHMMESTGTVLTEVSDFLLNGKKVYRAKVLLPLNQPLKDRIVTSHPDLGLITSYIVYERLNRAFFFCGLIGHEMGNCATRLRLARLKIEDRYKGRPEMDKILEPKLGSWLTSTARLPRTNGLRTESMANPEPPQTTPSHSTRPARERGSASNKSSAQNTTEEPSTAQNERFDLNSTLGRTLPPENVRNQNHKRTKLTDTIIQPEAQKQTVGSARGDEILSSQSTLKRMKAGSGAPPPWAQ